MSIVDKEPAGSSPLGERVKGLLFHPAAEWDKIDAEPATVQGLYAGYVCILAAIPAIAGVIGAVLSGTVLSSMFGLLHVSLISMLAGAVVRYVLTLASVFVLALVIDVLAPNFGGERSQIQAFKVAAYAGTPAWVTGVFQAFPPMALLGMVGAIYGLYVLYLGLPKLMKAPEDKGVAYTLATVAVYVVLFIFVFMLSGLFAGPIMPGHFGV